MQAIDGFLMVLDKDANILYVSETITDCVGLNQVSIKSTCNNNIQCTIIAHSFSLNSVIYYYPRCEYSTRPKAEWNIHTEGSNKHAIQ